uniref:MutL homolog 3 n=1 Tax=Malurus cyaneus samueli TaxID=2593467 RepID=A0A8C5X003_9PASS
MIKHLVEDVRARLRSGVTVNSLGQCVEELVLNSIDAKATCVAIRVDLEAFKIQVVDNGSGMGKEDLKAVGKRYFTSKCSSVRDLENLTSYGFRGEAVASIANMASVVEISSKTSRTAKTFVKLFYNGQALEVCEAELNRPSGGTTVTVCNLFHQLPVRRKCMDPVLEIERVRQKVEAISLMHPSVSLSLRNDVSCSMVLQLPKTRDVYSRFCQIYGLGRSQKLREINHKSGGFEISGFISTEGHYNKNIQFLYVNRRLVVKTRLHKLIDFLLRKESVICKAKSVPASRQASSSPGHHRCGPELYGIFILNVTCAYSDYDVCLEPSKTLIEFQNWDVLLTCIEEGVKIFLKREHLFIEPSGEDIREYNENNDFCLHNAPVLKPSILDEKSIQESFKKACNEIVDSYEMCTLQSKDVKRKSITGKKNSSLIESSKNVQETEIAPIQNTAELSGPCRSNKAEIPLPSKDDTVSDLMKSNTSQQEPKYTSSSQKVSDTHLKLSESFPSSFRGGTRSEIREIDGCDDLRAIQESNKVHNLNKDVIESLAEKDDPTETEVGHEIVSGTSLIRLCNTRRNREMAEVIDGARRGAVGSIPLKLRLTDLIKRVFQSEPQCNCEEAETNLALNTQCRPGPVSAKDTSGHKVNSVIQSSNAKGISSNTNKKYTASFTREVCMTDVNESKPLSHRVREEIAMPAATNKRPYKISNDTELPLATFSGIPHKKIVIKSARRQIAVPRPQPSKKLSLSSQLGSLEKFRRYYGRIKSMLPSPLSEQSEFGLPVLNSETNGDFSKNENDNHGNFSSCETPPAEDRFSNNTSQGFVSLENNLFCSGEMSQDKRALCQSPLTLSNYSLVSNKNTSFKRSPGSLSSKLSRMKTDHKEVEQLGEQFQTDSNRKDDHSVDLESSNNDFLYDVCQTYKSSVEKVKECKSSSSKGAVCSQSDGVIAESMKSSVSSSPLSSIEGEYTVSSGSVLTLSAKNDCTNMICKDESMLDESSEQNMKDTEVPHVTLQRNLEFSADNTSTGDPRNDLCDSVWLQDFDALLGKTIYINKATGLSTYDTPPSEGFQAACVQDITTMAVNVVSENDRVVDVLFLLGFFSLRCCYKNLEDLGLELSFPETNSSLILVRKVPMCFIEREANELRRKRQPIAKSIVEELIQEQVELVQTTRGGARGTLPLTFLKVLASQACHGAIKFNEHLTLEESCRLIEALSSCKLPFQCAHGRPSMLPLADTDHLQQEKQPKPNLTRLRKMARAWQLFGEKKRTYLKKVKTVNCNH